MPSPIDDHHADLFAQGIIDLGQPTSLETETYDGGLARVFEGGRIYFHPRLTSAFEVHGLILDRYVALGEEMSQLGYPTSDEMDDPFVLIGRMNTFENGILRFDPGQPDIIVEVVASPPVFVPRVIVKLFDGVASPIPPGTELDFSQFSLAFGFDPIVAQLAALLGDSTVRRCLQEVTPQALDDLLIRAQQETPPYSPPNFNNFLEIEIPPFVDPQQVATLIGQLVAFVEFAYVAGEPEDPAVVATNNPRFGDQRYLQAAPVGVGAQSAWATGVDGAGIGFIDIEQGWFLAHEDLRLLIRLLAGTNQVSSHFHGTAVLGIVLGEDNDKGVVGLAPNCDATLLSHVLPRGQERRERIGEVMALAAIALHRGDVLLLEIQFGVTENGVRRLLPIESQRLEFEVIRMVAAIGIVVVEAAGNGSVDLDTFLDQDGKQVLNRLNAADFRDSGAIMVGACRAEVPHAKLDRSNNGSRVDCHAWGERIASTGDPDTPNVRNIYWEPDREYRPGLFGFGGTSGASAIIAGCCILIQHMRETLPSISGSGRLNCEGMRALLQNPANGTDSFLISDKIGLMPDFEKIIANEVFV